MTLEYIADHAVDLTAIIGLLASFVGIWVKWSKPILRWFRNRFMFQSDLREFINTSNTERESFVKTYNKNAEKWDKAVGDIGKIKKQIENGLSHKMAMVAAGQYQLVRADTFPLFVCNETGKNEVVSLGYLNLLGLGFEAQEIITSIKWQNATCGELESDYIDAFQQAVTYKTDLMKECGFQNPITGEFRGVWRVFATCTEVGSALMFYGRFVPVDEKAQEIAEQFNWLIPE